MSTTSAESLLARAPGLYPPAVVALAILLGQTHGLPVSILVVGAGALGGGIWLLWSSLQGLAADSPLTLDEAMSLGAPSAEEEQKRAVLRALKDLEYEKTVGKINDKDYQELTQRYRKDAKRLLQMVDKDLDPQRREAEKELEKRLSLAKSKDNADSQSSEGSEKEEEE